MKARHESSSEVPETVQQAATLTLDRADANGLPRKAVAEAMGVPRSRVYEIGDGDSGRKLKAEEIARLVRATDDYTVLDVIERAVGRVAFVLPHSHRPGDVLALSAKSAKEFGAFLADIAGDTAQGWTEDELAQVKCDRDRLIAAVQATIARAEASLVTHRRRA